jgi:phospholipid N-methyltransferase
MNEIERIIDSYKKRDANSIDEKQFQFTHYRVNTALERELHYKRTIKKYSSDIGSLKLIEIGAGDGINLKFFKKIGFKESNLYTNELRPLMGDKIKTDFPNSTVHIGNAADLTYVNEFDICFQATVFTSVLSDTLKNSLADKMFEMTKPNGILIWYDFIYDNPWNRDVKGIKKKEVIKLFPLAKKISFQSVMLAPPIGRRVGRLYSVFNFLLPFLRSHIIAVIEK